MTEEQSTTARERLLEAMVLAIDDVTQITADDEERAAESAVVEILDNLPLVLEVAQEAGLVSREGLGYTWSSPNHDHGVYQLVTCRTDPKRPGS